jgi:S1-C subfamily serine protease
LIAPPGPFVGIRTIGYLGDKQVGSGPETADWRIKMVPIGNNPLSNRVYAIACASGAGGTPQAKPKPRSSSGSGIVVDDVGDVLTDNHVVDHCKSLTVKTSNSKPLVATGAATDPKNDLAILKIAYDVPLGDPAYFRSQSQPARLGEEVGVIGYPLPGLLSSEPKATFGQVNSVAGYNNRYTLLQISAPVQPGNSGGPVLDQSGQVIGVVVSQASLAVAAIVGNVPQNVNFAIRGEVTQIFLAARGSKITTGRRRQPLSTEQIAAVGLKSTVFVQCSAE